MKVYITDIRNNPRIVYIDGRRYVFPSKKEVLKDISLSAYRTLSKTPYIHVRLEEVEEPQEEPKVVEEVSPVIEPEIKEPEVKESEVKESEIVPLEELSTEEETDYSSMTKKELRAIIEGKGADTSGMTKSNMLDWLKDNS